MPPDADAFPRRSAVLMQADMLFRLERYREAEEILRRWLMTSPSSSVEVQAVLSEAISRQPGRYGEALAEAHRAIAQDPSAAIGYYVLAIILADGDPKAALAALDEALRCAPDRPAFYALRARIFLRLKQPKQALAAIEVARGLAPENVDCIQVHAVALLHNGKARQAREVIDAGLRLDPEDAAVHNAMGWTLLRLGEGELARLHFSQALRLKPKMANAREGLQHAMKARYPFYKWILSYFQWTQELSRSKRQVVGILYILSGILLIPVFIAAFIAITSNTNIDITWICLGVGVLVTIAFTVTPLSLWFFDLFLRFDPYGQLVMTKEQIWATNAFIAGVISIVLGLGEAMVSKNGLNGLGVFLASLAVSAVVIGWPGQRR